MQRLATAGNRKKNNFFITVQYTTQNKSKKERASYILLFD
jgi:hypothetical protein